MSELYDLRRGLTEHGVLLCFNGSFDHGIIEELGTAVKRYLQTEEAQKSAVTDIFSVYIEATQNVRNYAARADVTDDERRRLANGIVVISRQEDRYRISSGNLVCRTDAEALGERLKALRGLDKAVLKERFKQQLRSPLPPEAQGAGLGLLDMARRASEPFEYSLLPDGDDYVFFSLQVVI